MVLGLAGLLATHLIGGWVGPKPVSTTWRSENSWPYRDLNSVSSVVQPIARRYPSCYSRRNEYPKYNLLLLKYVT
jgi:hypothetical protein